MAEDELLKPEMPESVRDLMKLSIEQAKQAFETFAATSERAWKSLETTSQIAGAGIRSLYEKIAEITRNNAEANFALALSLQKARTSAKRWSFRPITCGSRRRHSHVSSKRFATLRLRSFRRVRLSPCARSHRRTRPSPDCIRFFMNWFVPSGSAG